MNNSTLLLNNISHDRLIGWLSFGRLQVHLHGHKPQSEEQVTGGKKERKKERGGDESQTSTLLILALTQTLENTSVTLTCTWKQRCEALFSL